MHLSFWNWRSISEHRYLIPFALVTFASCGGGDAPPTTPTEPGGSGNNPTPTAVVFTAAEVTLDRWGDSETVLARVVDAEGNALPTPVTYTSSDTAIVKVTGSGQLTSWRDGSATITASGAGFSATASVTVQVQGNEACPMPSTPAPGPVAGPRSFLTRNAATVTPGGLSAMGIAIDADGDGDQDVMFVSQDPTDAASYSSAIAYLNDGTGNFVEGTGAVFLNEDPGFSGPRDYAKADINADGLLDIFVANPGFDPGGIDGLDCANVACPGAPNAVLIAQAGGGFRNEAATRLSPNTSNGFTHEADIADIDCDGDPDLIEGAWSNDIANAPSALRINTGGVFALANDRFSGALPDASGSSFCDLDLDGDPDLVFGATASQVLIYTNDGFGSFRQLPKSVAPSPRTPESTTNYSDINCGDLTGDGFPDIVMHDHSFGPHNGKWMVLGNQGGMTFVDLRSALPDPEAEYQFPAGGGPSMMYDFNNDGWTDLMTGASTVDLQILWNTGDGFVATTPIGQYGEPVRGEAPAVADFDGDGFLDIYLQPGNTYPSEILFSR